MNSTKYFLPRLVAVFALCACFAAFVASAPQAAQTATSSVVKSNAITVGQDVSLQGTISELNDEYFLQLPGKEVYYKLKGLHDYSLMGAKVVVNGVVELVNQSEAVIAVHQYQVTGGNQSAAAPVSLM